MLKNFQFCCKNKEVPTVKSVHIFKDRADICDYWARMYLGITQRLDSVTLCRTRSAVSKTLALSVLKLIGIDISFLLYNLFFISHPLYCFKKLWHIPLDQLTDSSHEVSWSCCVHTGSDFEQAGASSIQLLTSFWKALEKFDL